MENSLDAPAPQDIMVAPADPAATPAAPNPSAPAAAGMAKGATTAAATPACTGPGRLVTALTAADPAVHR